MSLLRIRNIAQFLTFERNLANAVQYVAMNGCLSGQVCRVFLARLNSDLSLQHVASFGFSKDFIESYSPTTIIEAQTLLHAINEKALIIEPTFDELHNRKDKSIIWRSNIYLPLLPNYAATISTQCDVPNNQANYEYFESLRSVLNMYINLVDQLNTFTVERTNKPKSVSRGDKLSERQALILEMVKDGMTNKAIVDELGYSESLIRQETMAIYQKLGIEGRRELTRT